MKDTVLARTAAKFNQAPYNRPFDYRVAAMHVTHVHVYAVISDIL